MPRRSNLDPDAATKVSVAVTGPLAREIRRVTARFASLSIQPLSTHAVACRAIALGLTPLCDELLDAARAVVAADTPTTPATPATPATPTAAGQEDTTP